MQKVEDGGDGAKVVTKMMKYPGVGEACEVEDVQLGGVGFGVEKDGEGKKQVTNLKHFLVPPGPVQVSCGFGTLVICSGKDQTGNGRVWCLGLGPPAVVGRSNGKQRKAEEVGGEQEERKQDVGGKKFEEVVLPSGESVVAYGTTYATLGKVLKVAPLKEMFEGDEAKEEGQKNLLKLLRVNGVELFLVLGSKKVAQKPSTLQLNIFVKHEKINGGNMMLLFPMGDGKPQTGRHRSITRSGGLPGGKDWKDVAELPWCFSELKELIEKLVKPLVEFGLSLSEVSLNPKLPVVGGKLPDVVKTFSRLFNAREHSNAQEVLGCVFTRATWTDDGMFVPTALCFEATERVKRLIASTQKKRKEKESDSGSESDEEAGSDSDSDSGTVKKKKQKKSPAKKHDSPRKSVSPKKHDSPRTPGKRVSPVKRVSPNKKRKVGSGSDEEAGSDSNSDSDELGEEANIGSANELSGSDEDSDEDSDEVEVSTAQQDVKRSASL